MRKHETDGRSVKREQTREERGDKYIIKKRREIREKQEKGREKKTDIRKSTRAEKEEIIRKRTHKREDSEERGNRSGRR